MSDIIVRTNSGSVRGGVWENPRRIPWDLYQPNRPNLSAGEDMTTL